MPDVTDLARMLLDGRPPQGVFVVGLTGGVACGKTTLAESLARAFVEIGGAARVERANTDGFLRPNADLIARGLLDRKGFPETYDRDALHASLAGVRRTPTWFPGYSHRIYDVAPDLARLVAPPDVLIIEGLGLDRETPVDTLVYLDAEEADQEAWFSDRFLGFWEQGLTDDTSFYARFRDLDRDGARQVASLVWNSVNRPNLREHILPVRETADIVVRKGRDHAIVALQRTVIDD